MSRSDFRFEFQLPSSWIDAYCRSFDPKLMGIADSLLTPQPVKLSYFPNGKLAEKLANDGIDLAEAAADLGLGMHVQRRKDARSEGFYYRLTGTRFEIYANARLGQNTQSPMATVSAVKPLSKLTRRERSLPADVHFVPVWEEEACDLEALFNACRSLGAAEKLRREAAIKLSEPHGQEEMLADKSMHAVVRRNYGALRTLIELLEEKSKTEQVAAAAGQVLFEGVDEDAGADSGAGADGPEPVSNMPYLVVQVTQCSGDFNEKVQVQLVSATSCATARTRLVEIEGDFFYLEPLDRQRFASGESVTIERVPRFAMKAHSTSLHKFLSEETEGDWNALACMLCTPENLSAAKSEPIAGFFCESDDSPVQLNQQQKEAVSGALATPHGFFIQGPPGTGKTTVITEIVRQLAARGERILLLAPTHVAVDEVLCRIADQHDIFPVRLSWDDARVRTEVRRFTLSKVRGELLKKLLEAPVRTRQSFRSMAETLGRRLAVVDNFRNAGTRLEKSTQAAEGARQELAHYRQTFARDRAEVEQALAGFQVQHREAEKTLRTAEQHLVEAKAENENALQRQGLLGKVAGAMGFGEMPKRQARLVAAQRREKHCRIDTVRLKAKEDETAARLAVLNRERPQREGQLTAAIEAADAECRSAEQAYNVARSTMAADEVPAPADASKTSAELRWQLERTESYADLLQRWQELTGFGTDRDVETVESMARQIGDDLLQSSNLVCSTTAGVAGAPFIRETNFDTLIVDEASRVTDSEFLIGGIRARKWILVGDEKQLPPYVDQSDEHFLHALAALHRTERGASPTLDAAVAELATLWQEDEELHRFREDAVLKTAKGLEEDGRWRQAYRKPFGQAYRYLKGAGNPEKVLLDTLRLYMVCSLFERCVERVQGALRQPLIEQRRMLEPIARVVSEPVYQGKYESASAEELSRCGVIPLVTPTFGTPITFLDTGSHGRRAAETLVGNGFVNELEAKWIVDACHDYEWHLAQRQETPVWVSILCFYRAQARVIRKKLGHPSYRGFQRLRFHVIDAIDKIQGQESDLVFISFCRAHLGGRPGPRFGQWLQDLRRLNVASTRARRALVFVGHRPTLQRLSAFPEAVDFYRHLFALFSQHPDCMRLITDFRGLPK